MHAREAVERRAYLGQRKIHCDSSHKNLWGPTKNISSKVWHDVSLQVTISGGGIETQVIAACVREE